MTEARLKNRGAAPIVPDGGGACAVTPRSTLRNFTYFP